MKQTKEQSQFNFNIKNEISRKDSYAHYNVRNYPAVNLADEILNIAKISDS